MSKTMEDYLTLALCTQMFSGFNRCAAAELIRALGSEILEYSAGMTIIAAGTPAPETSRILLVLTGQIRHVHYDLRGAQTIVDYTMPGDVFGWAQALGGERVFHNAAVAGADSALLRLFIPDISSSVRNWPIFEHNLLKVIVDKSIRLERKVEVLSQRSVREKLLVYLRQESAIQGSRMFHVPLSRQALADYLCVDRTTLSTELSRMRQEGLIDFDKSFFALPERDDTEGNK